MATTNSPMRPVYDCMDCLGPVENEDRARCSACQADLEARNDAALARILGRPASEAEKVQP